MDPCRSDAYCHVTRFDNPGRRISEDELRSTPEGDLFLRRPHTRTGPPDVGAFEYPHVAARTSTTYRPNGECIEVSEPRGDRGEQHELHSARRPPRLPVPRFGHWQELLHLVGDDRGGIVDAVGHPLPVRTAARPPWRPPRPLRPDRIKDLINSGELRQYHDQYLRLSAQPGGSLRLPSGRLVATDPSSLDYDAVPFAVAVEPGCIR